MIGPITTLFLLMSVDGKISTGATDEFDVDRDFPLIQATKNGLHQYYEIEQTTDIWSLNSGRVLSKVGINNPKLNPQNIGVNFVIIDNNNMQLSGLLNMSKKADKLIIVTSNKNHIAFTLDNQLDNLHILYYPVLNFKDMFFKLNNTFGCKNITIQTGGTLNSIFLRQKLIDYLNLVIAPVLIGGKDTPSLIDGQSLIKRSDLPLLGGLKLLSANVLSDSYLQLKYKVIS